jgi:8-oxo-dGTP pyrophosphatase MutT (NUDIX family)
LRLDAGFIRQQFKHPPSWHPEVLSDRAPALTTLTPAAVLIPLVQRPSGELSVLLTRRTERLKKHAGQIAFPGGKIDASDPHAIHAALREAHEEVGIHPEHIEVLGTLPNYETGTGFAITPVVGLLAAGLALTLSADEVAEAFCVPLSFLMNPATHQRRSFEWEGKTREFFAMPYSMPPRHDASVSPSEPSPEYFIWGATAAMLRNLYRFLSA